MTPAQLTTYLPLIATIAGVTVSSLVSFIIFVFLSRKKDKQDRALELFTKFMTDEHYIKARLISQEYLVPNGARYKTSLMDDGKTLLDFEELNTTLAGLTDYDKQARFYIRSLTSFFWLVDQARANNQIPKNTKLFSKMYAWYWVFFIEARIQGIDDKRQWRKFEWMLEGSEDEVGMKGVKEEYAKMEKEWAKKKMAAEAAAKLEHQLKPTQALTERDELNSYEKQL